MKTKIITNTYLRDVDKYQIKLYLDEDNYYISVKKLISVREKFIIKDGLCVMDDGYYIFEVIPKNDNYAMRLFLNANKEPLEYYFDICKNNRLDCFSKVPCYDDLYLDITYLDGKINILDEAELIGAYNNSDVSLEDYELVYQMKDRLLDEINNKTNGAMNINYMKYLDDFS
ncbi:MAG: DUF402 domain-containing protein [Firmicutes bacterium]|nr:DUF402 domain-containing protein [Bacillota bacterium]